MTLRWLRAALLLPGVVLIAVPALLLSRGTAWALVTPPHALFWAALVLGALGLTLVVWTALLFARFGEGTAAPWDPPRRFVVRGPYRHVRNPMLTGVLLLLLAETLLFRSGALLLWLLAFALLNALYIPLVEERGLEARFGEDYRAYKRNVPRWVPRLTPWAPERSRL